LHESVSPSNPSSSKHQNDWNTRVIVPNIARHEARSALHVSRARPSCKEYGWDSCKQTIGLFQRQANGRRYGPLLALLVCFSGEEKMMSCTLAIAEGLLRR
jgi:hypothetical protein